MGGIGAWEMEMWDRRYEYKEEMICFGGDGGSEGRGGREGEEKDTKLICKGGRRRKIRPRDRRYVRIII